MQGVGSLRVVGALGRLGFSLGAVHDLRGMLGGRVEEVELHLAVPRVDDVVPDTRRDEDRPNRRGTGLCPAMAQASIRSPTGRVERGGRQVQKRH
jgi:hypothetical protein